MKKTVLLSLFMAIVGMSNAQVDTFDLNHMPRNYHLENWPDSGMFECDHYYNGQIWGARVLCVGVPANCSDPTINHSWERSVYGYDFWNIPNIRNFAVGKHSDTPISVAGIAFLYPRFKWDRTTGTRHIIRSEWISHDYDLLKLQLMDTSMNVLAEGCNLLTDSVGNPILRINVNGPSSLPEVHLAPNTYVDQNYQPITYDIYEAMFPSPITVTDSFYLALHFESSRQNKEPLSVPAPGIYEFLAINNNSGYAQGFRNYDFPEINWFAKSSYRYINDIEYISVVDDNWFTHDDVCEEKHGYMLIFPILETSCHVPTGLRWNPMGGGKVRLSWESGTWDTEWEVSYGLSGIAPEDGTIITATSTSAQLSGIGTDTHYVAYVRTKCVVRDTVWSDWSDSISIFLSTQGIDNMDKDGGIVLLPNPASNSVLLTTEAPLTGIDVYTAAGAFYKHLPASGNAADIDVSSWPSGTYLLHISTPIGITTKKLIVQ